MNAKVEVTSAEAVAVVDAYHALNLSSVSPSQRKALVDLIEKLYTTPEFQVAFDVANGDDEVCP